MGEKKASGRRVTIESTICIILITAIVTVIAFYSSILKYKDGAIASLNSELTDKDEQISSLISEKDALQLQIDDLNNQIINFTEIIELDKSEVLMDNYLENVKADTYISLSKKIDYAGYIKFDKIEGVATTETGEIYVQVIWSRSDFVFYNEKLILGEDRFFRFPVLPASNLEIRIGYDDPSNGTANIMVNIVYVY
jgi:cell division protein FtsL